MMAADSIDRKTAALFAPGDDIEEPVAHAAGADFYRRKFATIGKIAHGADFEREKLSRLFGGKKLEQFADLCVARGGAKCGLERILACSGTSRLRRGFRIESMTYKPS